LRSCGCQRARAAYYEKCGGTQIVLGRFKGGKLPDNVDLSKPVHLMGKCAEMFAKKIQEAGGVAICTPGCPPIEPLLSWNMMDGKENVIGNIFDEKNILKKFKSLLCFSKHVQEWKKKQNHL
jgi:hypothetical protein